MARFKAKPIVVEPGAHGQSGIASEATTPIVLLFGVTGDRAAHRLRQHRQSAAGAVARRAPARWRCACRSAPRGRQLIVQLLTESWLLAACGGVAGLFVAIATLQSHRVRSCRRKRRRRSRSSSRRPCCCSRRPLTLGTGFLFGLFPSLHSTRPDLIASLKNQAGQTVGRARPRRVSASSLATAQIALSMMLLVSAGLFTKSLRQRHARRRSA